jgi:uncharacterized coiled-coil protein SlyX
MSIGIRRENADRNEMRLVCHDTPFSLPKVLIYERLGLFNEQPELLRQTHYDVKANVTSEIFSEFIRRVQDQKIVITPENVDSLRLLAEEFRLAALIEECDGFIRDNPEPEPEQHDTDERLMNHISRLQDQIADQEMVIESLSHKVSISETSVRQLTGLVHDLRNIVTELRMEIATEKRRFEAEVYYRRGCELLFGTNGYFKSQTLAISWLKASADLNHSDSQYKFAKCIQDGLSSRKDVDLTAQYMKASADQHNSFGQSACSVLCRDGEGLERDYATAYRYARDSAEQGNSLGEANLGYCYANGIGVEKDPEKAAQYYRMSAEQGNPFGQLNYGYLLEIGSGVPRDVGAAVKYYKMAADQGYAHGQKSFAKMLETGQGVPKDIRLALKFYRKAEAQGVDEARKAVLRLLKS